MNKDATSKSAIDRGLIFFTSFPAIIPLPVVIHAHYNFPHGATIQ